MVNPPDVHPKVLNPTVLKLGFVSFFADVASEMLYPITPIFLTAVLGASMSSVGLIEGIAEGIASLLKTYSGHWSDSIARRKPFIIGGYLLAAISKPLIGFSNSWTGVLFARGLDRTGKGIRTAPRDALLAESVHSSQRGAAFGWHRAMDTLGAAVGPLIALLLLRDNPEELRPLFSWALLPGLAAVALVFLIREPRAERKSAPVRFKFRATWQLFDSKFKKFLYAWGLFSLTNSSDVFLLMKAKASGFSTSNIILVYCFYNLVYALSSPYLGRLSDRAKRRHVLMGGLAVFLFVYLAIGFATSAWQFRILFGVYGLYVGATEGVGKAFALDLTSPDLKGTAIGLLGTVTGFCTIIASLVAGLLWDHVNGHAPFIYGAAGAAIAIFSLTLQKES